MSNQKDKAFVQESIDAVLSGIQPDPFLAQRIMDGEREEPVVKKRLSTAIVLLVLLLFLTTAGIAVVRHFGILDYAPHQAANTAYMQKIMTLDQRWEGEYFAAVIHEAVFDGMKMTFTMSIEPKEGAEPVYVIPHIRATASGQPLNLWVMGGSGSFADDGFWVPDIMPEVSYDYEGWAVDVALSDDGRSFAPVAEDIQWEIDFHVLHTDWPIVFTEEDEPGMDEPEWTVAEYAAYEQQFFDAYRNKQVLLNRYGMFNLYALDEKIDSWYEAGISWQEAIENALTKEVFQLAETASFRFAAEGTPVKTNSEPVVFMLPEGWRAEVKELNVSTGQIGFSLRITRTDGTAAEYHDFPWDFALLAEDAETAFERASIGSREDGSILYTAHMTINGPTQRLQLIPVDREARIVHEPDENGRVSSSSMQRAVMENGAPLTEEQRQMQVTIELAP